MCLLVLSQRASFGLHPNLSVKQPSHRREPHPFQLLSKSDCKGGWLRQQDRASILQELSKTRSGHIASMFRTTRFGRSPEPIFCVGLFGSNTRCRAIAPGSGLDL